MTHYGSTLRSPASAPPPSTPTDSRLSEKKSRRYKLIIIDLCRPGDYAEHAVVAT